MASHALTKRGVLRLDRLVPMATTPVVEGLLGPSEARPPCRAAPPPSTLPGPRPRAREAHKVAGGRTCPTLLPLRRTPTGQAPRLVRVEGQSETPSPRLKDRQHPSCIVFALKADEAVVTIPDQGRFPPQPRLPLGLEPPVKDIVQRDVPQER